MPGLAELVFQQRSALLIVVAAAPLVWGLLARPAAAPPALSAGVILVLLGGGLRLAAVRRLGKRARVRRAKATVLVVDGPYAWLRSPLYAAALLMVGGLGLLAGLGAGAAVPLVLTWLVYDVAVRFEEQVLVRSHGAPAEAYLARVRRWLPLPPRAQARPSTPLVCWREVLWRERGGLVGLPAALGVLLGLSLSGVDEWLQAAAAAAASGPELALGVGAVALFAAAVNGLITARAAAFRARRRLLGDRVAVSRAVANLVDNALSYGPDESTIDVTVAREGRSAVLSVADRGPGVPADLRPRLFERFVRGDEAVRQRPDGAGLGLAVVRAVASGLGGEVSHLPRPGGGSVFRLRAPLAPPEEPQGTS